MQTPAVGPCPFSPSWRQSCGLWPLQQPWPTQRRSAGRWQHLGPRESRVWWSTGEAVAELLLSLGVEQPQLAALVLRCPYLFSWPTGERAALLFGQLMRLGLTAAEVARCFERQPTVAHSRTFEPGIAVLAPLLAAGSKAGGGQTGEQLLGDLQRGQPSAVGLLELKPGTLQQQLDNLEQRYGPHWSRKNKQAVIVAAMQQATLLLTTAPRKLLALEAVLQQEVGQQPGDGTRLLAGIVQYAARTAGCSEAKLRQRARALVAVSGAMLDARVLAELVVTLGPACCSIHNLNPAVCLHCRNLERSSCC